MFYAQLCTAYDIIYHYVTLLNLLWEQKVIVA